MSHVVQVSRFGNLARRLLSFKGAEPAFARVSDELHGELDLSEPPISDQLHLGWRHYAISQRFQADATHNSQTFFAIPAGALVIVEILRCVVKCAAAGGSDAELTTRRATAALAVAGAGVIISAGKPRDDRLGLVGTTAKLSTLVVAGHQADALIGSGEMSFVVDRFDAAINQTFDLVKDPKHDGIVITPGNAWGFAHPVVNAFMSHETFWRERNIEGTELLVTE